MKKMCIILGLLILNSAVYALDYAKDGFPPLQPRPVKTYGTTPDYNKITRAEKTILGQTYENQHVDVRLNRLEKTVFNRTYPKLSYDERLNNVIVNYRNNNFASNSAAAKKISKMEKKVFHRTFADDTAENRISRLEEQVFGTIQNGDIESRYSMLTKAVPHYNNDFYTTTIPDDPYFGLPSSGLRSLAGAFTNYMNRQFVGMPTGYTPPIGPYGVYNPSQRVNGSYRQSWGSRWGDTGAGVHILP